MFRRIIAIALSMSVLGWTLAVGGITPAIASVADDIAAKTRQVEELQRQIATLEDQATTVGQRSRTLESEVAKLNGMINRIQLEVQSLKASIDRTGLEIRQTTDEIKTAEEKITLHQQALGTYLQEVAASDRLPLSSLLIQYNAISEFFDYMNALQRAQENLQIIITDIKELHASLDTRRNSLEDKQRELEQLKGLQEIEQRQLATTKSTKNTLLKETKGQESKYQQLISESKSNLKRLQEQLYYLQQNGISALDATTYAKIAATSAGIRPAFLLALLEVESRLGLNVGSGNWKDDMYLCYMRLADIAKTSDRKAYYKKRAETEKNAYFSIIGSLGLDPNAQKVSREPSYGCGGAMGPAQFIPSTWLGYASQVMRLTGRSNANPWNTEDAFTAAAIKLAKGGATSQTRAGELAAAKAYISGNPNCSQAVCASYSNTILQKAATIQENL